MDSIQQVDVVPALGTEPDDPPALQEYMNCKLAMTRQLQFLERLLQVRGRKHQEASCRQLLTKLAEDRFTLAVVGQFKRGKSSLINALIGGELLPTGLLPLTSAITILRFGARPRLVITWMNSSMEDERPVSVLPEFVTERGNPGNRKQVRAVYMETNSPFLRRGVELVDTPGIGSAIAANTVTTEAFIPHCDAVVFVTAVDTPMTELELEFLRRLRHDVNKIFCVVNKTDMLVEPQLSQVMEFVRSQIKSCLGPQALIFPVSARSSLSPVATSENAGGSVAPLRNALAMFLASERADILLRVVLKRSLRLVALEHTDISAARGLAGAPQAVREEKKISIKADFTRIRDAVAHHIESRTAELFAAIRNAGTADIQRSMDTAVAGFIDDAIYANLDSHWKSARHVLPDITQRAAPAVERILNQWLAERQGEALAGILHWPTDLSQAINETSGDSDIFAGKAAWLPLSPDDSGPFSAGAEPRRLYMPTAPWALAAPRWMLYMPIILIRHPLRRWLDQQTLEYTARLKRMALERLDTFVTAQIKEFRERLDAGLRSKEENLLSDIDLAGGGRSDAFHSSLDEQAKTADCIQEALIALPVSIAGRTEVTDRIMPAQSGKFENQKTVTDIFSVTVSAGEVLDSLRFAGCPVCRRLEGVIFNALAAWQHQIIINDAAQQWFVRSLGFCPLHTWQLASISSPQGLSRGYPRLTRQLAASLRAVSTNAKVARQIQLFLANGATCPLCRLSADAEAQCLQNLAAILESGIGRQRYSASGGVCLRHLPGLLALVNGASGKRLILDEAASHLAMLSEDMQSFALKHGALRRQLINENEETSLTAALQKVAGIKSLCFPWRFDEIG